MFSDLKECTNFMNKKIIYFKKQIKLLKLKNIIFEMKKMKKSLYRLNNIVNPSEKNK